MSEDTKARIDKIIKDLDYRPSNIARSLKSNKSKLIGAIIADIENPFSNLIIKGLIDQSSELGYTLMISISNNSLEKENEVLREFQDNGVEGLIVDTVSSIENNLEKTSEQVPTVLIDRDADNFDANIVTSNNYELGTELMKHLIDSKFKTIGYFTENIENNTVRRNRYQAFKDSIKKQKDIKGYTYTINRKQMEENKSILKKFMSLPKPRVIVAGNGLIQMDLLRILKENQYTLGKDFNFCGFDDYYWSEMIGKEGITSIFQDSYNLGTEAINILYKQINNDKKSQEPIKKIVEGELIVRGSTRI